MSTKHHATPNPRYIVNQSLFNYTECVVLDLCTGHNLFTGSADDCRFFIAHKLQSQQTLEFVREA